MQRIPLGTAGAITLPNGQPGFQDMNLAAGIDGTDVPAVFMTSVQEELAAIVEGNGGTLDPANNGQLLAFIRGMFRTRVVGGTLTFYVSATGSDTNTGLTSSSPLATINKALALAAQNYDMTGTVIQINLTDGTFAGFTLDGSLVPALVDLVGDVSAPASCVISQVGGNAISVTRNGRLNIAGLKLTATGTEASYYNVGSAIVATAGANVTIGESVIFGTCSSNHIESWTGSGVTVASPGPNEGTPYSIAGGAGIAHAYAAPGGYISFADSALTLTGTPNFGGAFAVANEGIVSCYGCSFSGAATGSRYSVGLNGVIETNGAGANYLPGSAAGSFGSGGQYA
jgi:hypothetical protein